MTTLDFPRGIICFSCGLFIFLLGTGGFLNESAPTTLYFVSGSLGMLGMIFGLNVFFQDFQDY